MVIFIGICLTLLVFSVIVFFHELGHFLAARRAGIRVEEFGLGIPPRAKTLGTDAYGTEYTLNWLPIGGFVRLKWENSLTGSGKDSFVNAAYYNKAIVLLAGVTMNFILAWVIFSGLFMYGVSPLAINTKFATDIETKLIPDFDKAVELGIFEVRGISVRPMSGGIAEMAGFRDEDIILSIGSTPVNRAKDLISQIQTRSEGSIQFQVERAGSMIALEVTPKDGKIGAFIGERITKVNENFQYKYSFVDALWIGAQETWAQMRLTTELFGTLVRKLVNPVNTEERKEATQSLSGPIGLGNVFVNLAESKAGAGVILAIAAMISINLGIFNLLPFPALDGGRLVFVTIQTVLLRLSRGKINTEKIELRANFIGFALLMLLSIFVAYQDIVRIITK